MADPRAHENADYDFCGSEGDVFSDDEPATSRGTDSRPATVAAATSSPPPDDGSDFSGFSEVDFGSTESVYEDVERARTATPVESWWTSITPKERREIDQGSVTEQTVLLRRLCKIVGQQDAVLRLMLESLDAMVDAQKQTQKEVCGCLRELLQHSRHHP